MPLNQIVNSASFFAVSNQPQTCATLQGFFNTFNAGWVIDVFNGAVYATTNNCADIDPTTWN